MNNGDLMAFPGGGDASFGLTKHELFAAVASVPDWWLKDRVEMLRICERNLSLADPSCLRRERETVALIAQARGEYADAILAELGKETKP